MKLLLLALVLTLAGCGNQPAGDGTDNAEVRVDPTPASAPPPSKASLPPQTCDLPKLDFTDAPRLDQNARARLTDNFLEAFANACVEGLMAGDPLIDQDATVKDTIFVLDAPEANVTSLYFSPRGPTPKMLLESPFGNPPQVPSVADLHEAIYCWKKGATPEEEERDGRCLPD